MRLATTWPSSKMNGTSCERTSITARVPLLSPRSIAESGIERSRVMNPEFTDRRIVGHHFGSVLRQECVPFRATPGCRNPPDRAPTCRLLVSRNRLPVVFRLVVSSSRQIDERRMLLRAVADDLSALAFQIACKIHREPQPVLHCSLRRGIHPADKPLFSASISRSSVSDGA